MYKQIVFLIICISQLIGSRHHPANRQPLTADIEYRIVGGQTAQRGQFPYQVSLRFAEYIHLCGGTIINHYWIITAAHCTFRINVLFMSIAAGAHHIANDGYLYNVQKIVEHPKFEIWSLLADISLVQTEKSIEFNLNVHPISIGSNEFIMDGIWGVASGWGTILVSYTYKFKL